MLIYSDNRALEVARYLVLYHNFYPTNIFSQNLPKVVKNHFSYTLTSSLPPPSTFSRTLVVAPHFSTRRNFNRISVPSAYIRYRQIFHAYYINLINHQSYAWYSHIYVTIKLTNNRQIQANSHLTCANKREHALRSFNRLNAYAFHHVCTNSTINRSNHPQPSLEEFLVQNLFAIDY